MSNYNPHNLRRLQFENSLLRNKFRELFGFTSYLAEPAGDPVAENKALQRIIYTPTRTVCPKK